MSKRIAYLCNMNNNAFATVRYLRDRGYDAHVFRFPYEPKHFQPQADTFDDDFHDYYHETPWGNAYDLAKFSKLEIQRQLQDFDVVIGAGTAPAYMDYIGRQLDVFIPYGEDIITLATRVLAKPNVLMDRLLLRKHQRRGIRNARHIVMDLAEPNFVSSLLRLRPQGTWHKLTPPAIYEPQYRIESIKSDRIKSTHWQHFLRIRSQNELVIFHHSRHHWRSAPGQPDWILKGNDQILQGLKLFKDRNPELSFKLITFEYGPDVAASKKLAESLGLQENVEWLPVLPRREIRIGLAFSDIGVGEIHKSWYSYGVMLEVLAVGLPFIGRREGELASRRNSYPMMSVANGLEFAAALQKYRADTSMWRAMGQKSNDWLRRQMDEVVVILASIADTA